MDKLVIDGYCFSNSQDAKLALKEKNAISKIKDSIDISNTVAVYETYNKLVSKSYFVTPVGLGFLHEMRDYLKQFYDEDELKTITVLSKQKNKESNTLGEFNYKNLEKLKLENEKLNSLRQKLVIAVVAMVIIIVGMMFIVVTNENLGYFNAEEKLLNKYAAWQERLENWEQELIKREDELGIK